MFNLDSIPENKLSLLNFRITKKFMALSKKYGPFLQHIPARDRLDICCTAILKLHPPDVMQQGEGKPPVARDRAENYVFDVISDFPDSENLPNRLEELGKEELIALVSFVARDLLFPYYPYNYPILGEGTADNGEVFQFPRVAYLAEIFGKNLYSLIEWDKRCILAAYFSMQGFLASDVEYNPPVTYTLIQEQEELEIEGDYPISLFEYCANLEASEMSVLAEYLCYDLLKPPLDINEERNNPTTISNLTNFLQSQDSTDNVC